MKKYLLFSLILLSACGTLFSGTNQDVSFDSNVKGVKIFVGGIEICQTPCVYPLERKSSTTVIVAKKSGYEKKQLVLRSNLNKIAILNLTFWPSWLTDVATGGMWQYSRDGVYIDMERSNLKQAEISKVQQDVATRRFALFGYNELRIEAAAHQEQGEYLTALSSLSNQSPQELIKIINQSHSAVDLAHKLTNI